MQERSSERSGRHHWTCFASITRGGEFDTYGRMYRVGFESHLDGRRTRFSDVDGELEGSAFPLPLVPSPGSEVSGE